MKEFFALSAARYLSAFLGIARGILIPRFLTPGLYGVYKTYQMVSELSRIGTFGVLSALFRELPIAIARKDFRRRDLILGNGFWATIASLVPVIAAGSIGIAQGWIRFDDVPITRWFLLLIPLLVVDRLRIFFDVVFNGQKQFVLQAKLRWLDEGLATVVYLGATWYFGFAGLLGGALAINTLLVALYWRGSGFKLRRSVSVPLAREMATVGFPHLLNGLGNTIYMQVDRMVILATLGLTPMGFYAVGTTLTTQLVAASQIVGRILTPRMMERFSVRERVEDLRSVFIPPARLAAVVYAPAVVIGAVLAEPLFRLVLPQYEAGLLPFQFIILGAFFAAIFAAVHPFFLAIKKQWQLFRVYAATIPVALILDLGAIRLGLDLPGIALATAITQAGFVTIVLILALSNFTASRPRRLLEIAKIYWPIAPAALAWLAATSTRSALGLAQEPISGVVVEELAFVLLYGGCVLVVWRWIGVHKMFGLEAERG